MRTLLFAFGLALVASCGSSDGARDGVGDNCRCNISNGPGYDACVQNPDYGCDCTLPDGRTILEPPCDFSR